MRFRNLSIKNKIIGIIVLITLFAIGSGFTVVIVNDINIFKDDMLSNAFVNAGLIGDYLVSPLVFEDRKGAEDMLATLKGIQTVTNGILFDDNGALFASFNMNGETIKATFYGKETFSEFKENHLCLAYPIIFQDKWYGSLYLRFSTAMLDEKIRNYLATMISLMIALIFISYLLAAWVQRVISNPVLELAEVTEKISKGGDYTVQVHKHGDDEIGVLYDAFNNMLNQIRLREAERDKAENELRESEEVLRATFESTVDGILVVDNNGKVSSKNAQFGEMWHIPEEIFTSGDDKTLINHVLDRLTDPQEFMTKVKQLYDSTEESFDMIRVKDGRVLERFSCSLIQGGKAVGRVWNFRDMTARMNAEEEMKRLRNLLKNIIDSMPSVVVGVDNKGFVTQWNREAENVTGLAPEKAQGNILSEVFPQLAGEMEKMRRAVASRETQKDSKVTTMVDGERRFSDITVYPLISNGMEGAVIRVDDVTESVRIEEMMIQSEKMLSVGGLAAGMAHEINNPLAGIMQNAQNALRRTTEDSEVNRTAAADAGTSISAIKDFMEKRGIIRMLEAVRESGERAAVIVANMLSFSRKSESRFLFHEAPALLDKTVELASSDYDLKKEHDFRQIEILREYDPDLPQVYCEGTKIQQVILNLLKNAAQAMAEKKDRAEPPRITLRAMKEDEMIRLEVEDNGPGMPGKVRKRVFEPFYTTKGVGMGTGLGLSVSYFIVTENHGGTMMVESVHEKGSKFIILLPFERRPLQ